MESSTVMHIPIVAKDTNRQLTIKDLIGKVAKKHEADVIVYLGPIDESGCRKMMELCRNSGTGATVFLVMATYGGNPHCAYRLARTLQRRYQRIIACVPGRCASGGTLVVLAANKLVMGEFGVLGPIDIQVPKSDEYFEMTSGLTVGATIKALRSEAQATFREILFGLKDPRSGQITLRTAMETAATLTTGMFGPMFAQIDPMRIGEDGRSTRIMQEYGERLARGGKNTKADTVRRLVTGYPSHTFEIDREEASTLFERVEDPNYEERDLIAALENTALTPPSQSIVELSPAMEGRDEQSNEATNDSAASRRRSSEDGGDHSDAHGERDTQVQPSSERSPSSAPVD